MSDQSNERRFPEGDDWHRAVAMELAEKEVSCLSRIGGDGRITLMDCGANRGLWSRGFMSIYPGRVDAHLFEPSKKNCDFINEEHKRIFGAEAEPLNVNEAAVSDSIGTMKLYSDWDGSWFASLAPRGDAVLRLENAVNVTTLDAYTRSKGIEKVDFLKLDVEGWEFHALKGAEYMIYNKMVPRILFEFSQADVYTRTFFLDFWDFLSPLGYKISHVFEKKCHTVKEYSGQWEKHWGTSLYYAELQ